MSDGKTILAIDLGTQSLRINWLRTDDGSVLWRWQRPVDTVLDGPCVEQSVGQWAELLRDGLLAASAQSGVPDAIVACGPLAGFAPLDAEGTPLGPAVMYNDRRAACFVDQLSAVVGRRSDLPRPTIADPIPQALRLRRDMPEALDRAAHLLDATGWLNFSLCGTPTLDIYTQIRLYDASVRRRFSVDDVPFGHVAAMGEHIGVLLSGWQRRLNWPAIPVFAASFDSKTAYWGSGIAAAGDALDISGTVTSFGVVADAPLKDVKGQVYSVPFGQAWLARGSTAAAGSVLEWARQVMGIEIDDLNTLSLTEPLRADDAVFVPYLAGARAPLWQPTATAAIEGLTMQTDRAALCRMVLTGLALELRHIVTTIEACGTPVRTIRLAGGLARSPALTKIKAEILGRPVVPCADFELTTLGLCAIGATALGRYPTIADAARSLVALAEPVKPRSSRRAADALFERYVRLARRCATAAGDEKTTTGQAKVGCGIPAGTVAAVDRHAIDRHDAATDSI